MFKQLVDGLKKSFDGRQHLREINGCLVCEEPSFFKTCLACEMNMVFDHSNHHM